MNQFLNQTLIVIIFIVLIIALTFFIYWKIFFSKPMGMVVCGNCGWEGEQDALNSYSTAEEMDKGLWFHFCPDCGSSKIIHSPQKQDNASI